MIPSVSFNVGVQMMAWESGELRLEEEQELFQHLIDTGLAWQLQGCYGRYATALINAELCHPKETK